MRAPVRSRHDRRESKSPDLLPHTATPIIANTPVIITIAYRYRMYLIPALGHPHYRSTPVLRPYYTTIRIQVMLSYGLFYVLYYGELQVKARTHQRHNLEVHFMLRCQYSNIL